MARRFGIPAILALTVTLLATRASTQPLPPGYVDPQPILAAAAKAIGTDNLRCVTIAGTAYGGAVGQQRESAWNVDWPRIDSLANYTRTMNWDAKTMTEEFDRKPGLNPASWKYGVGWIDGPLQQTPASDASSSPARTPGTWTDRTAPPVAVAAGPGRDLSARHVAEPARLPQGRAHARRESESDVALGARRDGTRRPGGEAGEGARRLDHRERQVPRRRHHQPGEHAPAHSHLGRAIRCSAT